MNASYRGYRRTVINNLRWARKARTGNDIARIILEGRSEALCYVWSLRRLISCPTCGGLMRHG